MYWLHVDWQQHEHIEQWMNPLIDLKLTQPMDPEKKSLNGLFSLLNIRHPKKFKPFSHWPSKEILNLPPITTKSTHIHALIFGTSVVLLVPVVSVAAVALVTLLSLEVFLSSFCGADF